MSEPTALSISLVMPESTAAQLRQDVAIAAMLDAYVIDSPEMAEIASTELQSSIRRVKEIKEAKAGFVAPAKTIIANAESLFDPGIKAHEAFQAGIRAKLTTYTQEQKQIADERERVAAEERRKAAQKAEQEAAAERARAAEVAAAQQRQADEARAAAAAAQAEGDGKGAAAAAAQAAKLDEKAAATIENAEIKAQDVVAAAHMEAPAPIAVVPAVAGFSLVANWKAELQESYDEARAIKEIAAAIATGRTDLLALLKLDTSAADKLAKALKGAFNVPGLRAVNRPSSRSRAA